MPNLLLRWLVTSLSILTLPHLLSAVHVSGLGAALGAAAVIGLLNFLVRPVMILLTFPLTVLTLGFFILIINALIFQFTSGLVSGLQVDSFGAAFLSAVFVSLVSWAMNLSVAVRDGKRTLIIKRFRKDNAIDLTRDADTWRR